MTFEALLEQGKHYEKLHHTYFSNRGYIIDDKSDDIVFQQKDVDFQIEIPAVHTLTVEVKADDRIHKTGNVFVEIKHIRPSIGETRGWLTKCEADILCYYDTKTNKGYMINWKTLKPTLDPNGFNHIHRTVKFKNPHDIGTETYGYLCNVQELAKQGHILEEYQLH